MIDLLRTLVEKLRSKYGKTTVILFGSYARGDFNVWSDIDVIIVLEQFRGVKVIDRYMMLKDIPEMWKIEPILWTPEEAQKQLSKAMWRYALCQGHVVIADDFNITAGFRCQEEETKS